MQNRSAYCEDCSTGKLDEAVSRLTEEVALALAPPPPVAPAAMPAAGSAFAQPASNTVGSSVGEAVGNCVAKQVALQACSAIPSFGKIACQIAANAKFSGCP